jgi:hypothetical protein
MIDEPQTSSPSEAVAGHPSTATAHAQTNEAPSSPIPPVPTISSKLDLKIAAEDEHTDKLIRRIIVGVVIVIIVGLVLFVGLLTVISKAYPTKDAQGASNSSSGALGNENGSSSSSANPATGNASVGAEGQYCSNAINAALSC